MTAYPIQLLLLHNLASALVLDVSPRPDFLPNGRTAEQQQMLEDSFAGATAVATKVGVVGAVAKIWASTEGRARLLQGAPKYVFGVSTGHAGSTSLSSADSYYGQPKGHILFDFETQELHLGMKEKWSAWWDRRPNWEEQVEMVNSSYKAPIDQAMDKSNKRTYVDLGHHNVEGILEATPAVFGDDVLLVRIRRPRKDVAWSFHADEVSGRVKGALCDKWYRICPPRDKHLLAPKGEQQWSSEAWNQIPSLEQYFWFIDEVEAEFQELVTKHSSLSYLECDWEDDLAPCFKTMGAILGLQVANNGQGIISKKHTTEGGRSVEDEQLLNQAEENYKAKMGFSSEALSKIRKVQW